MIESEINVIKYAIETKYKNKIIYKENFKNENSFRFEDKIYSYKSISLKTKDDNKEFIKIIYSLSHEGKELIQNYNNLEDGIIKCLLKEADFPKNNHLIPQNLLKNWLVNDEGYYLSQNNHNGNISYKKAQGVTRFLSEDNVFTRIIGNKIYTIETGLFKYIDDNFKKIKDGKVVENLRKGNKDKTIHIEINEKEETFEIINNIYKFFGHYLKHNRYETAEYNSRIEKLFIMLMDFEKTGNNQNEIMKYITKDCVTYLEKMFKDHYSMSFVRIKENNKVNFGIGTWWTSQIECAEYKNLIILPIDPEICILINSKIIDIEEIINHEDNFNMFLMFGIEQYLSILNINQGGFLLINGKQNYIEYNNHVEEKGRYNFLQNYLNYSVQDKSIKDLISEGFDCNKLFYAQRVFDEMMKFENKFVVSIYCIIYENNVAQKVMFFVNDENLVNSLKFDEKGFRVKSSYTTFKTDIL